MAQLVLLLATPAMQLAPLVAVPAPRMAPLTMQASDPLGRARAAQQGRAPVNVPPPAGKVVPGAKPKRKSPQPLGSLQDARPVDEEDSVIVQGSSLRTWSYRDPSVQQVQVVLSTEGRPLDAGIELWCGPDNIPVQLRAYVEDGKMRPFTCVLETPRSPNTVAVRNVGQMELPFTASVYTEDIDQPSAECVASAMRVQGGAVRTFPFDASVESIQVLLQTDGRPLNARIELLQGPNTNKQIIEVYTEDGLDRPFFCLFMSPGAGNVVRIVNVGPVEYPMTAAVVPYSIDETLGRAPQLGGSSSVVMGGGGFGGFSGDVLR